jgi:segregation and condensation protein A
VGTILSDMLAPAHAEPPTTALGAGPGFVVELEAFSGPLDLLLHLLREEQLEISDIPISRIADQFLRAIHDLGLNQAADYLDMASRLVRLKAQMLLPRNPDDDEWEDPRAELVRRLLEYQQIREIAVWLGRAAERRSEQFARGYVAPAPEVPPPPLTLDAIALLQAVERVIAAIPSPVLHRVVARPLDVEGATRRIEQLLEEREELGWIEALGSHPTIVDVLSTLLALLELARRGSLRLVQTTAFAPMVIARDSSRSAA